MPGGAEPLDQDVAQRGRRGERTGAFGQPVAVQGESQRGLPQHHRGRRYTAVAAGKGDPGYAATAVMLGEAALALALDGDRLPARAGSLTPASALGEVLVERLRAAGHTYEVTAA